MRTFKTYLCEIKLKKEKFVLFVLIIQLITNIFSFILLVPTLIALGIFFSKKNFKNQCFYVYSIFLYAFQIISLFLNCFGCFFFLFLYLYPNYYQNKNLNEKYYLLIFIVLDLTILIQLWKYFIIKQFYYIMRALKKNNFQIKKLNETNDVIISDRSFENSHGFNDTDKNMISNNNIDKNESVDFENFIQKKEFK